MNRRFTIDGSDALEHELLELCDRIAESIQSIVPAHRLEGLLLGGGYGRGEGGVLRTPAGDRPYNDLEFYVLIRGPVFFSERRYRTALHELGERLSHTAGLEVEFKILSTARLRRSPVSMFYYDLVLGHQRLVGGPDLLDGCEHLRHAEKIPLHEATRLLMNRCSGLLFALERLQRSDFNADDADFVGRNLAKAQLAFGDVVLTAFGQYHHSCRERSRRLAQLPADHEMPWLEVIRRHHADGVSFKLHPFRCAESRADLMQRLGELRALGGTLWLWLEERRLHVHFASPREYAQSPVDKCPETSAWRNRLVHWKTAGLTAALRPEARRYPRERLLRNLSLLLWESTADPTADFTRRVEAYARDWRRFN
ncbi:MAG TPA: hypothetical protein VGM54_09615 [Chthoniobacter sp.]|jgi:hypothetical protein